MKKFKFLFVIALACIMIFPCFVEGKDTSNKESEKVLLYFFRGEGCSHCAEFESWLNEIMPQYENKLRVVDYEVWNNTENNELMQEVAKARNEEASGVPYIIVGEYGWNGFTDDYKKEITEAIDKTYSIESSKRFDIMKSIGKKVNLEEKDNTVSSIIAIILIILITGGIVFGIIKARKNTN